MGKLSGKPGPDPGTGGRPPKPIDVEVMKRAASIGCNNDEIGALLGMSDRAFEERMKREPELQEAYEIARGTGRATLRRLQWQEAMKGSPTMLVWLGKNMLGQTDRTQLSGPGGGAIELITGVRREIEEPPTIDGTALSIDTGIRRTNGHANGQDREDD